MPEIDALKLGPYTFTSRLFVGTGKYETFPLMAQALEASGCQVATVAVRRVNLAGKSTESLLDHVDRRRYTILPNTAGCFNAEDALRTARLAYLAGRIPRRPVAAPSSPTMGTIAPTT